MVLVSLIFNFFSNKTAHENNWMRKKIPTCSKDGKKFRGQLFLSCVTNGEFHFSNIKISKLRHAVKVGDKERFGKEQTSVQEPFPATNCEFTS